MASSLRSRESEKRDGNSTVELVRDRLFPLEADEIGGEEGQTEAGKQINTSALPSNAPARVASGCSSRFPSPSWRVRAARSRARVAFGSSRAVSIRTEDFCLRRET